MNAVETNERSRILDDEISEGKSTLTKLERELRSKDAPKVGTPEWAQLAAEYGRARATLDGLEQEKDRVSLSKWWPV